MAERLQGALVDAGCPPTQLSPVLESFEEATLVRSHAGIGEQDPRFLHPGRTLLILLEDAQERDLELLAAAPWVETMERELLTRGGVGRSGPSAAVRQILDRVPVLSGGLGGEAEEASESAWIEALLGLEPPLLALSLSEALDQLRHLHLRPKDDPVPARVAARAEAVLVPLAERLGGTLGRRFRWWSSRVGRHLLSR